mmetsp:Transcript_170/g.198  ORF Transcript_170/g.198 Transcript_170/m.198 type:complete len:596 (+) Transcript_170:143-1930(+)|eukprot:CAMPEP_0178918624 /NCGR_PEP_ID=MMETSP0786-20121207/13929_1 /TAXON_ID=186022 /ORGANISM="Thalassionema frauenfeldii, Strain CCMP 1798" /LENGTH=595 /DNA_ID=CAMNT_0020592353 /DNA_START=75 /DNA_END=1862 /DNA_ORIENTATION=+
MGVQAGCNGRKKNWAKIWNILLELYLIIAIKHSASAFFIDHHTTIPASHPKSYIVKRAKSSLTTRFTKKNSRALSEQHIVNICLHMTRDKDSEDSSEENNVSNELRRQKEAKSITNSTKIIVNTTRPDYSTRITQLEQIVSRQEIQIQKLKKECTDLRAAAEAFARVVDLLRQAGLGASTAEKKKGENPIKRSEVEEEKQNEDAEETSFQYFDDAEIFGRAPSSVIDAADAAGAAILAGMLGGQQRMLVDVRDAELSVDPDTFVQFMELAILPVAAGLEGLKSARNRVKIVFPTVSQLLLYRRSMALAAPEVVALSTLGFDPVEKRDQLVVLVAPSPDDDEGLATMNELLNPTDPNVEPLLQPVVVINHHMVPVSGPAKDFEVAYHLRLLSVQYMSGDERQAYTNSTKEGEDEPKGKREGRMDKSDESEDSTEKTVPKRESEPAETVEDKALEAAMKHAHEIGTNQGITRAMVIRAYPKPWHIFVDTSPDTDADFEVAATFDQEPTQDDVNFAIVECLEGSEREDELVAQQMQQALEEGQLDRVADMLGISPMDLEKQNQNSTTEDKEGGNQTEEDKDGGEDNDKNNNFYSDFDV